MATRIFLTKIFARFADRERIGEVSLRDAVRRAEFGLIDANLGGGVIKQRVARAGEGKSGGYRTIILYRMRNRAIFVHGFAKKDKDNIDANDLRFFRQLAHDLLNMDEPEMDEAVASGRWREVSGE